MYSYGLTQVFLFGNNKGNNNQSSAPQITGKRTRNVCLLCFSLGYRINNLQMVRVSKRPFAFPHLL